MQLNAKAGERTREASTSAGHSGKGAGTSVRGWNDRVENPLRKEQYSLSQSQIT